MKLIKCILTILLISIVPIACSSDDNKDTVPSKEKEKTEEQLILTANANEVYIDQEVTFTATVGGKVMEDVIINHIEGNETVSNPWIANEIGSYNFIASKKGYQSSNKLTIKVKSKEGDEDITPEITGTGSFTYQGKTYSIDHSVLSYEGRFNSVTTPGVIDTAWILRSFNKESNLIVLSMFFTPVKTNAEGKYEFELPGEKNNITRTMLSIYEGDRELAYTRDKVSIEASFGAIQSNNTISGKIKTTCANFNNSTFELNYEGEYIINLEDWTDED